MARLLITTTTTTTITKIMRRTRMLLLPILLAAAAAFIILHRSLALHEQQLHLVEREEQAEKGENNNGDGEQEENQKQQQQQQQGREEEEEEQARRWVSFEIFPGRLNNQLITLDWAVRAALGFNRTVLVQDPVNDITWIGLNYLSNGFMARNSREEKSSGLWYLHADPGDLAAEEAIRHIVFSSTDPPSLPPLESLSAKCIYDPFMKNVVKFMRIANSLPECRDRIHFPTAQGLVHPWKSDTRDMGVDPLIFWRLLRPAPYLALQAQAFIGQNRNSSRVVAVHTRAHNSYLEPAPIAFARCDRLSEKLLTAARDFLGLLDRECEEGKVKPMEYTIKAVLSFWGEVEQCKSDTDLESKIDYFFEKLHLKDMCHLTQNILHLSQTIGVSPGNAKNKIILCTDKELPDVDELFYRAGAVSFKYSESVFRGLRLRLDSKSLKQIQNLVPKREEVLMDMLIMTYSDIFVGAPSSTLSFVVCMWRYAWRGFLEKDNYFPQLDTMCPIAMLATCGSKRCCRR